MSQPVLVTLIGWPLYIALVVGLIAWVWWKNEKPLKEMRKKNAQLDEALRALKTASEQSTSSDSTEPRQESVR